MYLTHFGLREYPFSLTPDTEFFFSSTPAQEALNTLLVAARTGEGFLKITGDVGTGKTMLCRKLMASLDPEFKIAYIPNPYLEPNGLLAEVATELGVSQVAAISTNQQQLVRAIFERLIDLSRDGRRAIVCLDEVQAMATETLEALRLLTNLETEKQKLLQVILFAQPEVEDRLNQDSVRQLRQRITFQHQLSALHKEELGRYIEHRLSVAGYDGPALFSRLAIWRIRLATKGVPRLVNIVAHKALLSAYGKGRKQVGLSDVNAAIRDTPALEKDPHFKGRMVVWLIVLAASIVWLLIDRGVFR